MTDDMDADDATELTVNHALEKAATAKDLKRQVATWAKRWTLGLGLSLLAALLLERARLLPLLTSIFALISLASLLIRFNFSNRQSPPK